MPQPHTVVIAEGDESVSRQIARFLSEAGYATEACIDRAAFTGLLTSDAHFSCILVNIALPGSSDGQDLLSLIQAERPLVPVVMMADTSTLDHAVQSMKAGAFDFITSPVDEARLTIIVDHATDLFVLGSERTQQKRDRYGRLRGGSKPMLALYSTIEHVARSKATIFVHGESGVGKEVVALTLHERSDRAAKPFVPLNCAAVPKALMESELFGHEAGAFTGANRQVIGKCEAANEGTLFLDEICEMPLDVQAKLLRFLQNLEVQRLGSSSLRTVDVRVIAATNRDPQVEVRAGRMREDLFYRLNVVPVHVVPLRERKGDIELLANVFLREFAALTNKLFSSIEPPALAAMQAYPWPGNVRELRNMLERVVVLNDDTMLRMEHLPMEIADQATVSAVTPINSGSVDPRAIRPLHEIERLAILEAYEACDGNVTMMAERLETSVATLYRRLKEYNILGNDRASKAS